MSTAILTMSEIQLPFSRNYKAEATDRTPYWTHIERQVIFTVVVAAIIAATTTEPRIIEVLLYEFPFQVVPVATFGSLILLWWQAWNDYQTARLENLRGLVVDHLWEEAQKAMNSLKREEFMVADYLVANYFVGTAISQGWTKTQAMRKELLEAFENIEDEAILAPILRWKRSDKEREKLVEEYYAVYQAYFKRLPLVQEDLRTVLQHTRRMIQEGQNISST